MMTTTRAMDLTYSTSRFKGSMSTLAWFRTCCSSSAEFVITYTMKPRRSRSSARAVVVGEVGDPAMTVGYV